MWVRGFAKPPLAPLSPGAPSQQGALGFSGLSGLPPPGTDKPGHRKQAETSPFVFFIPILNTAQRLRGDWKGNIVPGGDMRGREEEPCLHHGVKCPAPCAPGGSA